MTNMQIFSRLRAPGSVRSAILAACLLAGTAPAGAHAVHHHRHRHATAHATRRATVRTPQTYGYGYGYGAVPSTTPDCRYPDGTPFDPDIIGGPNHVGDGGPAVNLGGYPPCGF